MIETRIDEKRGCGWRKPGGLYLIGGKLAAPCGKLPIPLTVCPTCGHGIKPSRGWTWINGKVLAANQACRAAGYCERCPLCDPPEQVGLLWIREAAGAQDFVLFLEEASGAGLVVLLVESGA